MHYRNNNIAQVLQTTDVVSNVLVTDGGNGRINFYYSDPSGSLVGFTNNGYLEYTVYAGTISAKVIGQK